MLKRELHIYFLFQTTEKRNVEKRGNILICYLLVKIEFQSITILTALSLILYFFYYTRLCIVSFCFYNKKIIIIIIVLWKQPQRACFIHEDRRFGREKKKMATTITNNVQKQNVTWKVALIVSAANIFLDRFWVSIHDSNSSSNSNSSKCTYKILLCYVQSVSNSYLKYFFAQQV